MTNLIPILAGTLVLFLIVTLIVKLKKSPVVQVPPKSTQPEPKRCKTFLVTRVDSSLKSVVVFENCSGTIESLELISPSLEICAVEIKQGINVTTSKLFDYCVK